MFYIIDFAPFRAELAFLLKTFQFLAILAGILVLKSAIITAPCFNVFFSVLLPLCIFAIIANYPLKNSFKINSKKKITPKQPKKASKKSLKKTRKKSSPKSTKKTPQKHQKKTRKKITSLFFQKKHQKTPKKAQKSSPSL